MPDYCGQSGRSLLPRLVNTLCILSGQHTWDSFWGLNWSYNGFIPSWLHVLDENEILAYAPIEIIQPGICGKNFDTLLVISLYATGFLLSLKK